MFAPFDPPVNNMCFYFEKQKQKQKQIEIRPDFKCFSYTEQKRNVTCIFEACFLVT